MVEQKVLEEFVQGLKPEPKDTNTVHTAIVSNIDDEGVVWVNINGSDKETPTELVATEVKRGDAVTVQWRNNKLYVASNYTNPSAGVVRVSAVEAAAQTAQSAANNAVADADRAKEAAEDAIATAESVHSIAQQAAEDAAEAKTSATNASEYASRALGNLSTVQSVTETLNWITQHGTMTLTTDTALDPSHVYFILDPNGDYTVSGNKYRVVTEPKVADIATYYELSIDESLNNYVATHLSLTDKGLYVVGGDTENEGYKILLASDGMTVYDAQGVAVSKFGENIEFSSTRPQYIGGETAYIVFNPENGTINAGGEGFRFNNNMTLSDMLAEIGKIGGEDGLEQSTEDLLQKTKSISYENGKLIISGGENSNMKLVMESDRIGFYDGENEVAYISNNQMCIPRSIVLDSLDMGDNKWRWTLNTDDHLTLQWIGG